MSQAIIIHETGGPGVLTWENLDVDDPGPGEIRLVQSAIGLNFIDLHYRTGHYPQPLPFTPGLEGAGMVDAIGKGVSSLKVGDRVAYAGPIGAYAEVRLIAADRVVNLPDAITFEQAAAIMLKGMTAQVLLQRTYRVEPGDTILIHAAAGATGLIMCQWAAALGATVLGTVSSEAKANLARAHGCHHPIIYTEQDFVAEVLRITGGEKLAVVYDSVGRDTFLRSFDCLRVGGMMVAFGQSSGAVEPFAPVLLSQKGSLYLTRPFLFHHIEKRKDLEATAHDLFEMILTGKLRPNIHQRWALRDAASAHGALEKRSTTGSTVLTV
jgi:NADPH2:quinone reductase